MTGKEFLKKVRRIKKITDIHWRVEGKDVLDPDLVKVVIVADGEEIEITYPLPPDKTGINFIQFSAMALIINKFMEQIGNDFRINFIDDIANAINYSRKQIKERV
ncbi:hypothetical protein SAMN05443428_11161 [Caloramator quimbayensis]|uniref:Uncharacterized protein n=1 Tax=Caloramator quimbayensis TaxID=1147123 RepID=A0A1T4XQQ5_9CLOT|nr:hypothetical protein [Caloramator quimbayensis]SKA91451.1 hypothetical protein SAMN05443428_11161 [Caloramator quimbayensis]